MTMECRRVRDELEAYAPVVDLALDPGIRRAVLLLRSHGVQTTESCEGGPGHAMPEPTVYFEGDLDEGKRAVRAALDAGLPVLYLRQCHCVEEGGRLTPPRWQMVFCPSVATLA